MGNEITLESLATVVGAVPATALILQFVKIFWRPGNAVMRQIAAILGAVLVVAAGYMINDTVSIELAVALVFGGLTAGLAASQAYEISVDGMAHETMLEQPVVAPPDHPDNQ